MHNITTWDRHTYIPGIMGQTSRGILEPLLVAWYISHNLDGQTSVDTWASVTVPSRLACTVFNLRRLARAVDSNGVITLSFQASRFPTQGLAVYDC